MSSLMPYLSIPIVSGLVGYLTNWLAIRMMLYPLQFRGIGRIGWQGVVPANAHRMARITVDHSVRQVMTQEELVSRIDADTLLQATDQRIERFAEDMVDEMMQEASTLRRWHLGKVAWEVAPLRLRHMAYAYIRKRLPGFVARTINDLKPQLDDLIDLNDMVIERLSQDTRLLVRVFERAIGPEFAFIKRSGYYFGIPLGLPVMVAWYFFPVWWLLPLFGACVGYLTNIIALYLVQKPLRPVRFGPWTFHGLFVRRQKEVARVYGRLFANEVLGAEIIIGEIARNENSAQALRHLVDREVSESMEALLGRLRILTVIGLGTAEYARLKKIVSDRAYDEIVRADKKTCAVLDQMFDIENTVADRVGKLPPEEFYALVHPVIAEDEWKLIAVGAALGTVAGCLQWLILT